MAGHRFVSALLVLAMLAAGGWYWKKQGYPFPGITIPLGTRVDSRAAFDDWLAQDPARAARFAEFERFLESRDVSGIVPAWQLARVDGFYAERCEQSPFMIPPEDSWPKIVPALELVRKNVVPQMGEVQVLSSYRSPEINVCAGGASGSNHLDFAALDLATVPRRRGPELYSDVCAMHRDAGGQSGMGLGAYFNPQEPQASGGRFHIDAAGYRTWGRDYTSRSSPCARLLADENMSETGAN